MLMNYVFGTENGFLIPMEFSNYSGNAYSEMATPAIFFQFGGEK